MRVNRSKLEYRSEGYGKLPYDERDARLPIKNNPDKVPPPSIKTDPPKKKD